MDSVQAKKIFDLLYENIHGFEVSITARRRLGINDKSYTYGEIDFESFKKILDITKPQAGEVFYDLGSGTGKPVISAALLFPFSKLYGLEILNDLHELSKKILEEFEILYPDYADHVEFIKADLMDYDFANGDVIYIASTCFSTEFMEKLTKKIELTKPGTRIITLTKKFKSDKLEKIHSDTHAMSWGNTTVMIYRRI